MFLDWVSFLLTASAVVAGLVLLFCGQGRSGVRIGSEATNKKRQSLLLQADQDTRKAGGNDSATEAASQHDGHHVSEPETCSSPTHPIDEHPQSHDADAFRTTRPGIPHVRYGLGKPEALPPRPPGVAAEIWEVCSLDDATALLAGCPFTSTICCGFFVPYADGMDAQRATIEAIAAVQPAGFVFATVDIKSCKEVAAWAGVGLDSPLVRLLRPDGEIVADFRRQQVRQGQLHRKVLSMALEVAKSAEPKLQKLAERFVGALSNNAVAVPCSRSGLEKMRHRGVDALRRTSLSCCENYFLTLCQICEVPRVSRVREIANLAKIVREVVPSEALPFLDLARRLAEQKLLGGTDPGAREAHELLLDAVLCCAFDADGSDLSLIMLALHFLVNCFAWEHLREGLLPVVGQLLRSNHWRTIWQAPMVSAARTQEAAIDLMLNASVAFRSASCRVEHQVVLAAAIEALFRMPSNDRINLAVGNLLVVGGTPDNAKRALQAQPVPTLRALAAALFRGDLDGPDGCAFPVAWQPEAHATDGPGTAGQGATGAAARHPFRAPIPARHRGRGGG